MPRILAVTPADVQRTVKTYLDPEKRVVVYVGSAQGRGPFTVPQSAKRQAARSARADATVGGDFPLKDVKRVELPNGLTLLLYEDHRLPIITAQAQLRRVNAYETNDKLGEAALTGLLLQEGTTKHSGPEIADMIESVGGALELSSAGGTVKVLSPNRSLGLSLLVECLTKPAFAKDDFQREQRNAVHIATNKRRSRKSWRRGLSRRRSTASTREAGRRWVRSRRWRRSEAGRLRRLP